MILHDETSIYSLMIWRRYSHGIQVKCTVEECVFMIYVINTVGKQTPHQRSTGEVNKYHVPVTRFKSTEDSIDDKVYELPDNGNHE